MKFELRDLGEMPVRKRPKKKGGCDVCLDCWEGVGLGVGDEAVFLPETDEIRKGKFEKRVYRVVVIDVRQRRGYRCAKVTVREKNTREVFSCPISRLYVNYHREDCTGGNCNCRVQRCGVGSR